MLTVVTGAAGFVGAALARRMAQVGYPGTVRLVDRHQPEPPGKLHVTIAELARTPARRLSPLLRMSGPRHSSIAWSKWRLRSRAP